MDTRYLEQFVTIESSRSMRDAAEKAFLSQATLSHDLKRLENELGCQLFDRSRNRLELNAYGKIMLARAKRIISELEEAKREISEEKLKQAQKIQIGVYGYAFQSFVLPGLANELKENAFDARILDWPALEEGLTRGALDFIITDHVSKNGEIAVHRLFKEQIMVSLPATSRYALQQSVFAKELPEMDLLLPSNASGYTLWFARVLAAAGVEDPLKNSVPFKEYLYAKNSGDKCCLTSSFIIRFLPTAARRVLLPLAEEDGMREIFMAYKKRDGKRLAPLADYFEKRKDQLFVDSAFLPYFLFAGETKNLHFRDGVE